MQFVRRRILLDYYYNPCSFIASKKVNCLNGVWTSKLLSSVRILMDLYLVLRCHYSCGRGGRNNREHAVRWQLTRRFFSCSLKTGSIDISWCCCSAFSCRISRDSLIIKSGEHITLRKIGLFLIQCEAISFKFLCSLLYVVRCLKYINYKCTYLLTYCIVYPCLDS